jgi:hypothetical protein
MNFSASNWAPRGRISVTRANTDLKRHLLIALAGAVLFTCESWALGPFSWIYAYGAGLEVIPSHLALSKPGQNFSLWAPFIAGGLDRLSFFGNADGSVRIEPDGKAAIDAVAKGNPEEAIVEASDVALLGSQRQFGVGSVSIRQNQPDEIILGVQPKEEGFLVIANTWHSYWKACLDGKPATLIRTNHAQFGLPVPKNVQLVQLRYEPLCANARLFSCPVDAGRWRS